MDIEHDNTPQWGYCQVVDCKNEAIPCYLPDTYPPNEPDDLLCADHAHEQGYCWGCGLFWAGVESFDFRTSGLCDNCHSEQEQDDYDPELDFGFDDPFDEDLKGLRV